MSTQDFFFPCQVPTLFEALEVISPAIPVEKWQLKSCPCLCFDNHLAECAIFPPVQFTFRPAAATPGYVVILFDPGRRETPRIAVWKV